MDHLRRGFLRGLFFGLKPEIHQEKTLVCIFLRGGADTLNMIVPYGDDTYYTLRPTISIGVPVKGNTNKALKLDNFYGFHPKLAPLLPAYKEGRLGIVQAVGSDNLTGSHFEAQDQMEHGEGRGQTLGGGWLGRHLRSFPNTKLHSLSAVAIGPIVPEVLRGAPTAMALQSLEQVQLKATQDPAAVSRALSALYKTEVGVLGQQGKETFDLLKRVENLKSKEYKPEGGARYPQNDFGKGLREIARLIKAHVGLQAACIDLGGWDTHFFQGSSGGLQANQVDQLALGLSAFDLDLKKFRKSITTIVMTEFGRRTYENSSLGTDHGRGFAFMALGEKIHGGQVHGQWPGLKESKESGPGGLQVKVDYRSVLSEILVKNMGNPNISKVFPKFTPKLIGIAKG